MAGHVGPTVSCKRRPAAAVLVGLLFMYLLTPAFTGAHVEGFSAQIQSMALAVAEGWTERHDLDLPIVTQFIFTSRPGTLALLAGLDILGGGSSDANFRLLVAASLLVLLAASCVFARRWGGASYTFALLALILVPGSLVLGFYFADNVVSTAFVATAMAVVGRHSRLPTFAAAGALMAAAVLCRIDAVLALPMVALLAPMQRPTSRHVALAALAFLTGFVPVTVIASWLAGFTFLDSVAVAQLFRQPGTEWRGLVQGLYFFGLIAPPLLATGALVELRPLLAWRIGFGSDVRLRWRLALLILYPVGLLAYAAFASSEMRYLFPFLLPIIALHGAAGIERLVLALKGSGAPFATALVFLLGSAAVFFAPPLIVQMRDGPSSLLGNAWSPMLWHRWQSTQERSFARVDAVVRDVATRRRTVLVSSAWNDEFYMRLRLMEAGYRSVDTATTFPGCRGFATYRRGPSEVLHLRFWPQYWRSPFPAPEHAALKLTSANRCPAFRGTQDIWLVNFGRAAASHFKGSGFDKLYIRSALEVPITTDPLGGRLRAAIGKERGEVIQMPTLAARVMPRAELAALALQTSFLRNGHLVSSAILTKELDADAASYQSLAVGSRRWSALEPENRSRSTSDAR